MPFKKGHPGFKPKGVKSKKTIMKEEAMAEAKKRLADELYSAVVKRADEISDKLITNHPTYVADRIMGKVEEKVKYSGEVDMSIGDKELEELAEELAKKIRKEKEGEGEEDRNADVSS